MKIDTTPFQHFSFDLWLTLIKSNTQFKSKRAQLFKDFFSIESSIDKVSEVIHSYDKLCNNINDKTGIHIDTFQIYGFILNDLNGNIDEITLNKLEEFYLETEILFLAHKPTLIYSSTSKFLKNLVAEGKTMNILSNTAFIKGSTLRKIICHYELEDLFSFQLYSDEIKYSKPNPIVFQELINQAIFYNSKINKSNIVHIGDNEIADYKGALKAGINSILIKN